jgi:L-fuculose-phosphate aldolase
MHRLFISTQGTFSARLPEGSFLFTPHDMDRAYIDVDDLVLIKDGAKEQGKTPSRFVGLHQLIYRRHPHIRSIIGAAPIHAMAFAVTDAPFSTRTIPESYAVLRQVQKAPFALAYSEHDTIVNMLSERAPIVICENSHILATGSSPLQAFDRLEVMEATARTILAAQSLGNMVSITDTEVEELNTVFSLT